MSDPKLPHFSGFCKCPVCGEYFNSEKPFDKHRRGQYPARRCLSKEEMEAKGMVLSKKGYWLSKTHSQSLPHWRTSDDL